MRLATKFSLMTAALIGAVVLAVALTITQAQKGILEAQERERLEAVMDGVGRIAQESVDARDELMLISYLKHLKRDRPEIAVAEVTRRGRTQTLGEPAPYAEGAGLIRLTRTAVERVPVTFTVNAYPARDAAPPEVKVSSEGISLNLPSDALVKMTQERKPQTVLVSLGFIEDSLKAEIRRALKPMAHRTIAIAAFFMSLGGLGAMTLGKLLTSPLSALTAAVGAVGRGKLDTVVAEDRRDEVGVLEHSFNEMTSRIKGLMQFKEDLLHTLTHELNTPLTGLKGHLELWRDRKLPPEAQAEALATMTAAVLRMESSLGNALRLFRDPAGLGPGPRKVVWLDDVFGQVLSILSPLAGSKRITVRPPPEASSDFLYADEDMLRQVIANLVSNAFKYTPEGGEVSLALEGDAGEVRFWVSDTGCGIKPEDIPHIFTKFYRADDPSRRIPGSGLGLSIAHRAVTTMGGTIKVESQVGKGSIFTVAIPRKPRAGAQENQR
ncbi:MAG: HAMP domain-containing histidine kinase [Elusimicrobia bacterium]|nr:HAMP domain-containing histidine kinase [Elusimicrobiota bacterium]